MNADIKCHLVHTNLREHPPYKALSHTWDVVKVLYQIAVDDYHYGIGPNLKAAFESIRHSKKPTYLWVDAICINQKDIAERNYQVIIMHWIYQCALQVIIWLGEQSLDSDCSMDVLEDENIDKRMNLYPAFEDGITVMTYTGQDLATWKALSHFFARSY